MGGCTSGTYGWVYPKRSTCTKESDLMKKECTKHNGKFVFYLCPLQLNSRESLRIETITHEGSHHATAYTDDWEYARSPCQRLAISRPDRALNNADNFCYYIQDI